MQVHVSPLGSEAHPNFFRVFFTLLVMHGKSLLHNEILLNLDKGFCSVLMLLDNSAAFDTVDHDELISDLENEIGVQGTALNWFISFLGGRTQATSV